MTGANFSSWFNNAEGTVYADIPASSGTGTVWQLGIGGNDRFALERQTSTTGRILWNVGGVGQASFSGLQLTSGGTAFSYKVNDGAFVGTTGVLVTDTSAILPTVNALYIGNYSSGVAQLNGHIRKLSYYPQRLTDTQLQAITG